MKEASICIVCEGYEEYDYLTKLIEKNLFSNKYKIKLINAKGINNLYSRYTDKYRSSSYHIVLIFCDTDKEKQMSYWTLKEKINKFHNKTVASSIIIFGNPCTMQIILSHFEKVSLKKPSKKMNSNIIKKLTGIENYSATDKERKELMNKITQKSYYKMKENLKNISSDDNIVPSTNFLQLINNLEQEDSSWIKELNDYLENEDNT